MLNWWLFKNILQNPRGSYEDTVKGEDHLSVCRQILCSRFSLLRIKTTGKINNLQKLTPCPPRRHTQGEKEALTFIGARNEFLFLAHLLLMSLSWDDLLEKGLLRQNCSLWSWHRFLSPVDWAQPGRVGGKVPQCRCLVTTWLVGDVGLLGWPWWSGQASCFVQMSCTGLLSRLFWSKGLKRALRARANAAVYLQGILQRKVVSSKQPRSCEVLWEVWMTPAAWSKALFSHLREGRAVIQWSYASQRGAASGCWTCLCFRPVWGRQ